MKYPKFGTIKECPACGFKSIVGTAFHGVKKRDGAKLEDKSYITRQCSRCKYTWKETPLYLCEDDPECICGHVGIEVLNISDGTVEVTYGLFDDNGEKLVGYRDTASISEGCTVQFNLGGKICLDFEGE